MAAAHHRSWHSHDRKTAGRRFMGRVVAGPVNAVEKDIAKQIEPHVVSGRQSRVEDAESIGIELALRKFPAQPVGKETCREFPWTDEMELRLRQFGRDVRKDMVELRQVLL